MPALSTSPRLSAVTIANGRHRIGRDIALFLSLDHTIAHGPATRDAHPGTTAFSRLGPYAHYIQYRGPSWWCKGNPARPGTALFVSTISWSWERCGCSTKPVVA